MNRLLAWFCPRLRVNITCPHGQFIPATYDVGGSGHRLSCDDCRFLIRLDWVKP